MIIFMGDWANTTLSYSARLWPAKNAEFHTTRSSPDEARCHGVGLLWDHHFHTFSGIFVPGKAVGQTWGDFELKRADSFFVPGKFSQLKIIEDLGHVVTT